MIIAIARCMSGLDELQALCFFAYANNYLWRKLFTAQDNSKVRIARRVLKNLYPFSKVVK